MAEDEKLRRVAWWMYRCLCAEKYIELSPCDPDIKPEQMKAYEEWKAVKNGGDIPDEFFSKIMQIVAA